MPLEIQEVTQKTVGFSWSVTIETEKREESGTKYPDKMVAKASLSGHADSYDEAVAGLKKAGEAVKAELKKLGEED